jgi:3-dehydroquinate dehydratase
MGKEIIKLSATETGLVFRHVQYTKGGPITIEATTITVAPGRVKQFNLEQERKEFSFLNNSKLNE